MDIETERTLLDKIKLNAEILMSKKNDKDIRRKKDKCWEDIRVSMLISTGKEFTADQLCKKWSNIQNRLKEKIAKRNQTGGGSVVKFCDNDNIAMDIIGELNPKISKVPGAVCTFSISSHNVHENNQHNNSSCMFENVSDDDEDTHTRASNKIQSVKCCDTFNNSSCSGSKNGTSCSSVKRKKDDLKSLKPFEEEILLLEKEKFKSCIEIMEMKKRKLQLQIAQLEAKTPIANPSFYVAPPDRQYNSESCSYITLGNGNISAAGFNHSHPYQH